jgi:hypothetical protein
MAADVRARHTAADIKWWFGTTLTAVPKALTDTGPVEADLYGSPGCAVRGWRIRDDRRIIAL